MADNVDTDSGDDDIDGKTITISGATSLTQLATIRTRAGDDGNVTHTAVADDYDNLVNTDTDLAGADYVNIVNKTVTVNDEHTLQEGITLRDIVTDSGGNNKVVTNETVEDSSENFVNAVEDGGNYNELNDYTGKTISLLDAATSLQFATIVNELGGDGTITGAVEDDRDGLADNRDLSLASSVTLVLTEATKDLSGETLDTEITHVNMNNLSDVKAKISDLSGKTLQNIGTYTIVDTAENILAATSYAANVADNAAQEDNYITLYGATNIIITEWDSENQDLSGVSYDASRDFIDGADNTEGISVTDPSSIRIQLDMAAATDREISADDAAKLATIDQFNLTGNSDGNTEGDLTIDADVFTTTGDGLVLTALDTISAETSGNTNNLTIADVGDADDGSSFDLNTIQTLTNIDAISIVGDEGSNDIQLSNALTTHGSTTIHLAGVGNTDTAADKVIFNLKDTDFKSGDPDSLHTDDLGMTLVNNFNVSHDQFGVYYQASASNITGYSEDAETGRAFSTSTSSFNSGTANLTKDRLFVENDSLGKDGDVTDMNNVDEIKTAIADSIASFVEGSNRLTFATYLSDGDNHTAVLAAADFVGLSDTSDLTTSETYDIAAIAELRGVETNSLGSTVTPFNMTNKPDAFS